MVANKNLTVYTTGNSQPTFVFLHFRHHTPATGWGFFFVFFFVFGPSKTELWLTDANLKANI